MTPLDLEPPCAFTVLTREREAAAARRAAYDADTAEALRLWVVLSRAYAAVQAHAAADVGRHGLNLPEFGALEALYHAGPMLVGDLQRRILMSSGGMTPLLDRLARRGLVERRACPNDRRATYVGLTPDGVAFVAEIFPAHATRVREALAGVPRAARPDLAARLKQLGLGAAACDARSADDRLDATAGCASASRRGRRRAGATAVDA